MTTMATQSLIVKCPQGMQPCTIDINQPRWDQKTFSGRLQHFIRICNPLLNFKSTKELEQAAELVQQARTGCIPQGTSMKQLYKAKVLYDSAYHPDTGDKMNLIGRMSFQVPGGMVITGGMLVYYRTLAEVAAAQWVNQSFNALVNYTNRNAKSSVTTGQIATAYVGATTGAVTMSVFLNSLVKSAPAIIARMVPWAAVTAANCINIPVMRQRELIEGIMVTDVEGTDLGPSQRAAVKGISLVTSSRVFMASCTMLLTPIIMTRLERRLSALATNKLLSVAVQTLICGAISMKFTHLEPALQNKIRQKCTKIPETVYFNKGL